MNARHRRIAKLLLFVAVASCVEAPLPPPSDPSLKKEVDEVVYPALASGKHVGLVVGVLKEGRRAVFGYGVTSAVDDRSPDGSSLFEIGSITKAFTGILFADMAAEGLLSLDDQVRKHLPDSVRLPSRNGKEITLAHLATHTSGLPRLPADLLSGDSANPYAHYTLEDLYRALSSHPLGRDPGERYEYSNLGMGLLGHVLAHRAGCSYEELVVARICSKLGMADTRITLSEDQKRRLAPGHSGPGKPVSNWDLPTFAGAGALRSTAADLLKFLSANLDGASGSFGRAAEAAHVPRAKALDDGTKIGLGWHVAPLRATGRTVVRHSGGTGGYRSFAGFVKETRTAVVVLANCATDVSDLGVRVLEQLNW